MANSTDRLRVPVLTVPFAVHRSPHAGHARECIIDFLGEFDLEENPRLAEDRARLGDFMTLAYPFGDDKERLGTLAKVVAWLLVIDDNYFERPLLNGQPEKAMQFASRCLAIADAPERKLADPLPGLRAWHYLCHEILKSGGNQRYGRFVAGLRAWIVAVATELFHTTNKSMPDAEAFESYRAYSTGYYGWMFEFIDYAAGRELPPSLWSHPDIRRLEYLSSLLPGIFNDVTGLVSDPYPEKAFCLPVAIARERGIPLQEGIEAASALFERYCVELQGLAQRLIDTGDDDASLLARGALAIPAGHLHWHMQVSQRYRDYQRYANPKYDAFAGALALPDAAAGKVSLEQAS